MIIRIAAPKTLVLFIAAAVFAIPGAALVEAAELTKAQAVARVRAILKNSTGGCRINSVNSVTAARVKAGWRVTARIVMSASGRRVSEKAIWIVSERNGAVAQDQLTSEIANRCNN